MTMMRWNPRSPLSDLFDDLFGNPQEENVERKSYECAPATNIIEKNNSFELQMALPGVKKEDVKIDLEKNLLSIASEKSVKDTEEEDVKFTRREFAYGTFCRTFTLPETIDTGKINAKVEDGILTVELPKKEETRISKEIRIS